MSYVSLIVLFLQLVNRLLEWGQQQKWIKEGEDRVIAASSAEILRKTQYGKKALEEFSSMSESDVDDFLRGLGDDANSK